MSKDQLGSCIANTHEKALAKCSPTLSSDHFSGMLPYMGHWCMTGHTRAETEGRPYLNVEGQRDEQNGQHELKHL